MGNYIPDTVSIQKEMLQSIGKESIDALYEDVPSNVRLKELHIPEGKPEMAVASAMKKIAAQNKVYDSLFRGAGAYRHYIPAIVKGIVTKEEFLTAYTPYQAEISQGVLQSIFEYQTQICELTGLDVSNASVYDGAVAAAEAVFMTIDKNKTEALVSNTIDPRVLEVIRTYGESRNVRITVTDDLYKTDATKLADLINENTACVLVQSPNYYGIIEDVEEIVSIAHEKKIKVIESVNPISLGLLKSPGELGVDIAVGEGQPLGMPLSFGGPYLGFMATTKELTRKLPGRIVGQTTDHEGRRCFVLTLQAREQHIRREKASSNICSNEALCAMTASVYLAAVGPEGLHKVAKNCYDHAHYLKESLASIGFKAVNEEPFFHEFLTDSPIDPVVLEKKLKEKGILIGLIKDDKILWCATELNDKEEIDHLIKAIREVI
ncbi:MAG: aminomethyl-transferring glycine dehydrogenase subunit GcvPA [Erysipelotrichaceae bacterium]|nr:aminomethyl-transferring glycine dehydrogenase subunit GcvPA [Erysipelotrichaceae bacterium]